MCQAKITAWLILRVDYQIRQSYAFYISNLVVCTIGRQLRLQCIV